MSFISFTIRPAPWDPNKTLIHPAGYPIEAPPMLSIVTSKEAKPNLVLLFGWGSGPQDVIGNASFPKSFHSTFHLMLRGQHFDMRTSQSGSGECKFDHPVMGPMKWKPSLMSSSKMELVDGSGRRVAQFGKGKSGEKTLDVLQADPYFTEMVFLSGLTAIKYNKKETETALEVFSAVAGA